jgi:phosphopantothenoylcysteine synthetase/decarboxylase
MKTVVGILLELQRMGVQVFLSTHDYVILKEFDLQAAKEDKILFHSLFRNPDTQEIEIASTADYLNISPNAIDDTFGSIVDREIEKSMGGLGK